jgi:MFS family permease
MILTATITVLFYAFLLGLVHGITPDEHTWPITFSYAIGSFSSRKGLYVAILFSLAFTVQRAIASEIAYFALINWHQFPALNYYVYLIVGLAMFLVGVYVLRFHKIFHIELLPSSWLGRHKHHEFNDTPRQVKPSMALLHGFIAGWGFGAFALILYTVLVPKMPNMYVAFLPGVFFGLGTMFVQAIFGSIFGRWIRNMNVPESEGLKLASRVAGNTLFGGGLVFILGGLFGLLFPNIANLHIVTPVNVHNLHNLGLAFIMVMTTVLFIGVGSIYINMHKIKEKYQNADKTT